MLTLNQIWEKKNYYTRCASEQARNLCYVGLAVVWIFRVPNGTGSGSAIPILLMWCALGFICALALDLMQYLVGARKVDRVGKGIQNKLIAEGKDPAGATEAVYSYPEGHPRLMDLIWLAKIIVTSLTWLLLLVYVGKAAVTATLPTIS